MLRSHNPHPIHIPIKGYSFVKRSNRLVILVGVLLAVLAFVGVVILLQGNGTEGPTGNEPAKVNVLVATRDISVGDVVTSDMVEQTQVNPDEVVGTRFGDPSQLFGDRALYDVPSGSQVPQELFGAGTGVAAIESQLLAGEKAIAFQVDRVTGLDFLIRPGDHIDVVMSQQVVPLQETQDSIDARAEDDTLQPRYETVNGLTNPRTVKTILTDKRVLYVSATRNVPVVSQATPSPGQQAQQTTPQIDSVIIVIAGTDQDAELIKFAQQDLGEVGQLTALIRRAADAEDPNVVEEDTTGITLQLLIDDYGVPIPNIVVLPPQTPIPSP